MPLELNFKILDEITDEKTLYKKALASCKKYLKNWWQEDEAGFCETMRADLETVLETYQFEKGLFTLKKSYYYEPILYYIVIKIKISDKNQQYILDYACYFDEELEAFDDNIKPIEPSMESN